MTHTVYFDCWHVIMIWPSDISRHIQRTKEAINILSPDSNGKVSQAASIVILKDRPGQGGWHGNSPWKHTWTHVTLCGCASARTQPPLHVRCPVSPPSPPHLLSHQPFFPPCFLPPTHRILRVLSVFCHNPSSSTALDMGRSLVDIYQVQGEREKGPQTV